MTSVIARDGAPALRTHPIAVLYTVTAFAGAALLFLVEPMAARMLLPSYGGAASVWATCTLFFQVVLLLGYVFVHLTSRLGPRGQPLTLAPLLLLPLLVLPLALPSDATPESSPVFWLLRTLLVMIGLPFAVLTTTGPVLQRWYSWLDVPRARDPYFLYAASNVGSFVGLLAYPFAVEPHLSLGDQRTLWSWAFLGFLVLVATCGVVAFQGHRTDAPVEHSERPAVRRMLTWLALAFLPSSLMLGVTTHLTTDVAPVPLLWVVPLAIYLATFVIAFAGAGRRRPGTAAAVAVVLVIATRALTAGERVLPLPLTVLTHLAMLGVVAYVAHALLAADRPAADHLTLFFVVVSVGGALGGLFNGLLAPLVFDRVIEYALVLAGVPLLWLALGATRWIALTMTAVLAVGAFVSLPQGEVLARSRTFYGSYVVVQTPDLVEMRHGTTVHGFQSRNPGERTEPTSYYARNGPLGDVFDTVGTNLVDITAVGLGTGTVAAYGLPGQTIRFIEIDPEVVRIANDRRYFTFLADSAAAVETTTGDGRLRVAELAPATTDLLVLDAFSSDAIPVHLLTAEAFAEYATRIRPGGSIAVHISNLYFDLAPVIAGAAERLGWHAAIGKGGSKPLGVRSAWIALSPAGGLADTLVAKSSWTTLTGTAEQAWSDDHASLLAVLR
ncbi:spermidine synthase [Nocardioides sp. CPCC 206347]|uniref:spermidine synthase n=3 Tax=Nocardioides TaxID=1839 RepID=UPI003B4282B2